MKILNLTGQYRDDLKKLSKAGGYFSLILFAIVSSLSVKQTSKNVLNSFDAIDNYTYIPPEVRNLTLSQLIPPLREAIAASSVTVKNLAFLINTSTFTASVLLFLAYNTYWLTKKACGKNSLPVAAFPTAAEVAAEVEVKVEVETETEAEAEAEAEAKKTELPLFNYFNAVKKFAAVFSIAVFIYSLIYMQRKVNEMRHPHKQFTSCEYAFPFANYLFDSCDTSDMGKLLTFGAYPWLGLFGSFFAFFAGFSVIGLPLSQSRWVKNINEKLKGPCVKNINGEVVAFIFNLSLIALPIGLIPALINSISFGNKLADSNYCGSILSCASRAFTNRFTAEDDCDAAACAVVLGGFLSHFQLGKVMSSLFLCAVISVILGVASQWLPGIKNKLTPAIAEEKNKRLEKTFTNFKIYFSLGTVLSSAIILIPAYLYSNTIRELGVGLAVKGKGVVDTWGLFPPCSVGTSFLSDYGRSLVGLKPHCDANTEVRAITGFIVMFMLSALVGGGGAFAVCWLKEAISWGKSLFKTDEAASPESADTSKAGALEEARMPLLDDSARLGTQPDLNIR